MTTHYYSKQPNIAHDRQVIEYTLRDKKLKFTTDAGVFSKKGIDYGSRLLIESMEIPSAPGTKVLDVGCGYGPIGLYAAVLQPQCEVTMVDVNERAIELAKENAGLNGIRNIAVKQSDGYDQLLNDESFDVILTNPPIRAGKAVVHRILSESVHWLSPQGVLWVVIQKKQGAPSAFAKLEECFHRVEEVCKDKGYRIFKATQPIVYQT